MLTRAQLVPTSINPLTGERKRNRVGGSSVSVAATNGTKCIVMACSRCGKCCLIVTVMVIKPGMELRRPCPNWDEETHLCGDYENRPQVCRDFLCEDARKEVEHAR